jgi:hypothetical protein
LSKESKETCYDCGKKVPKGVAYCENCVNKEYKISKEYNISSKDKRKKLSKIKRKTIVKDILELKSRYSDLDFLSFESADEVAENGIFRINDKKIIFEDGHHSRIFELECNKIKTIEPKNVLVKIKSGIISGIIKTKYEEKLIGIMIKTSADGNHAFFFDSLPADVSINKIISKIRSLKKIPK